MNFSRKSIPVHCFSIPLAVAIASSMVLKTESLGAQTTVYQDNFSESQGSTYTTAGQIGTSPWTVSRSGDDWGARIDGGVMTLNNDATTAPQAAGWVYSSRVMESSGDFSTTFSSSGGLMSWTFNMRQPRTSPGGFSSGSYGVAYVIGSTSASVASQGSGYAVVLGNSSSPDPVRFVSFSSGMSGLGTTNTGLILATSPLANPTNNYLSIKLTYNPLGNVWELFGRDDGTVTFADPAGGSLVSLGTAIDSTYTGEALTYTGAYWQGSTATGQAAQFDNVRLEIVPEPSPPALIALSALVGLIFLLKTKSGVCCPRRSSR